MKPKISIVTPIYQTETYLEKCLTALTNQTLNEIELIWIDNGANQSCKDIIKSCQSENVKLVVLAENIGYLGAMTVGLNVATGNYVGFCDSDDWVDADYYEKLYNTIIEKRADVVYCGYSCEFEDHFVKEPLRTLELQNCKGAIFEALPAGSVWNALFKRTFILNNNISFPKSVKSVYRDNTFSIPACFYTQKYALDATVYYHYRQRENSTVQGITKKEASKAASEVISETFPKLPLGELSATEVKIFTDFLFRTLPVRNIKKLPKEAAVLSKSEYFKKKYLNARTYHSPSLFQRIFSVSYHSTKPIMKLRFLGISIRFKLKQRRSL